MFLKFKNQFYLVEIDIEKNDNNYAKVTNFEEFQQALKNENIKIIELENDLDLGYNYIKEKIEISSITSHNEPISHPKLIESGISKIEIQNRDGLIICSKNGSKITHANIIIKNSKNIKIENIKMEELWEWDEETQAEYDRNDWDYISIKNSDNICIKNCEFSKSYDGIIDIQNGTNITIEYCKINSIDIYSEFYNAQFEYLEENIDNYPMYKFLRTEAKLTIDEIKNLVSHQYKVCLIGTQKSGNKENKNIIIHDNLFINTKARMPRVRNSKVYVYNNYVDCTDISNIQKNMTRNEKETYKLIEEKYRSIVSFSTHGITATDNSYILAENCVFKDIVHKYTKDDSSFIVVIPRIITEENLKNKLEQIVGNKYGDY